MWLLLVIPFAIAAGSEILNEDCSLPIHRVCRADETPDAFPTTAEELEAHCDAYFKFLRCGLSVEERCKFNPEVIEPVRRILSIMDEVCDKDGRLHAKVVNNLQCLNDLIEAETPRKCSLHLMDEEEIEARVEALIEGGIDSEREHTVRKCLPHLLPIACGVVVVEKSCGEDAADLILETISRTSDLLMEGCTEEVVEFLPAAVTMYKLEHQLD